jgi:hypothetical protein
MVTRRPAREFRFPDYPDDCVVALSPRRSARITT